MPEEIKQRLIEEEMKESYVDYAMSVITARALPDVRDGLKPVQRRILYMMYKLNLLHNKPYRKSAHIIGNVMARLHPHGDLAIYDALARMAQDFSLRYPLVDGQGNWGNIDGDAVAASRYTEARLAKLAEEILLDIEKDTVNLIPNYDNSAKEPVVLPAKLPNLLINGSSGIAVGMATNIPPHNISEVLSAVISQINNPEISIQELMQFIKAPDFPTAGIISGLNGIKNAYFTGRGHIIVKSKAEIQNNKIIITEIPYQVNKSQLLENTASLVRNKKLHDITDIRDESDRDGIRIVIETRKNSNADVVLNQLYAHTQFQTTFPVIMLALVNGEPKILNLKEIINYYILHRKEVVTRKTKFELNEAQEKAHILEGLKIALDNLDSAIKIIKSSENPEKAKLSLIENFKLTEKQSLAILDMKLQRLTSLEHDKIKNEHTSLLKLIEELKTILASEQKIFEIIKNELLELKEKYKDERRTQVIAAEETEIQDESLIPQQQIVITSTHLGYIKQTSLELYKQQKRGGKGIIATETKDQDFVKHLFVTSNHNYLLFFTNKGKVYWLKAFNIPEASRYSKGKAIINLLNLEQNERINAILPISKFKEDHYLLFATKQGLLKKTPLAEYSNPRKSGIIAIKLRENDELVKVKLTAGNKNFILATKNGSAVRFSENDVAPTGRASSGVRGVKLENLNDEVIGLEPEIEAHTLLTITEKGHGKRTPIADYRLIRRGGKGVTNIKITEKNGKVVAIKTVSDEDEIILITEKGIVIRIPIKDISTIGRNTQGVRIIRLDENDKLKAVAKVIKAEAL